LAAGPKLHRAKELLHLIVNLLDDNFLLNLIVFDETVTIW
jgi:hypothetical protein